MQLHRIFCALGSEDTGGEELHNRRSSLRECIDIEQGKYDENCFEASKKMIRLLRHDPTVLREEGGAVEFRILASMLHSQSTSSPYLSIRTSLNYLQKGGGAKKRNQYCVDPCSADSILYLRAIQGHSGGKHISPHYKTTSCYRVTSPSKSTTLEAPTSCTGSYNQD